MSFHQFPHSFSRNMEYRIRHDNFAGLFQCVQTMSSQPTHSSPVRKTSNQAISHRKISRIFRYTLRGLMAHKPPLKTSSSPLSLSSALTTTSRFKIKFRLEKCSASLGVLVSMMSCWIVPRCARWKYLFSVEPAKTWTERSEPKTIIVWARSTRWRALSRLGKPHLMSH